MMTVLFDLVGELSWGLKAAWIMWCAWIAIQVVWRRRARVEVRAREAPARGRLGERLTLGIAAGPEPIRVTTPEGSRPPRRPSMTQPESQTAVAMSVTILDGVEPAPAEPAAASKRPRRRRPAPRSETPSALPA